MKATFLIAASLIVGTAAMAQTTTPDSTTTQTTPTDSSAMQPGAAPADATTAAPAADPSATAAPSTGANALPTPTTADMSSYPACSRSVHDHCVQKGAGTRKRR